VNVKYCAYGQDAAGLVVLDDFFGERERRGLLDSLGETGVAAPPQGSWERNTADDAHGSKTWGLKAGVLLSLAADPTPAMLEIQSRLVCPLPPLPWGIPTAGGMSPRHPSVVLSQWFLTTDQTSHEPSPK